MTHTVFHAGANTRAGGSPSSRCAIAPHKRLGAQPFHAGANTLARGSTIAPRAPAPDLPAPRPQSPFHTGANIPAGGSAPTTRTVAIQPRTGHPKCLPSPALGRGPGWGWGATGSPK
jgi:hypothetical protein